MKGVSTITSKDRERKISRKGFLSRMAVHERSKAENIAIVAITLVAAVIIAEVLYRLGANEVVMLIVFTLASVVVSATTDGYMYGIAGTAMGVVIYDFFYLEPRAMFSITRGTPITLLALLGVSLVASAFMAQTKNRARIAEEKEKRAEVIYSITRRLFLAQDSAEVATIGNEFLGEYMDRSVVFYLERPEEQGQHYALKARDDLNPEKLVQGEELAAAQKAFDEHIPTGFGTEIYSDAEAVYFPIAAKDVVLGIVGISGQKGSIIELERIFVRMMLSQVSMALQVENLMQEQQRAEIAAETEKVRSSFLRAISHDLRTPLTGILGAADALIQNSDSMGEEMSNQLLQDISSDAQWLLRMVENILSVTRIYHDGEASVKVNKTMEAAEEIIAEAVASVRKRYPQANIIITPPAELILVPMDAMLMMQVLINLLENAVRHGGKEGVTVTILAQKTEDGYAEFKVSDDGKGIDGVLLPHLFEIHGKEYLQTEDASRGLGIGLSICRNIVQAHGGEATGENAPAGGAEFTVRLPLAQEEENGN